MKTISRLYQKIRPFITAILVIAFIFISYNSIINQNDPIIKIIIGVMSVFVIIVSVFYEYLKLEYSKLQKQLVAAKPIKTIEEMRHQLEQKDKINSLKDSFVLFDILFYFDKNQPQQVLNLIENNERLFKTSLDYLLIKRYSIFKAYTLLNNRTQAKKAYLELAKLKETNLNKAKKMNLLYNWDQIEALNLSFNDKDYSKAIKLYEQISTINMNPRELIHLYVEMKETYNHLNNQIKYQEINEKIRQISPTSPFLRG